jgi:drug/metabolite transporter (DMT)-like permease
VSDTVPQTAAHPALVQALNERLRGGIGVAAVLAATICWSTAGVIAFKSETRGLPLTFWRVLIVAALFGVAMVGTRQRLTWWVIRQAAPAGAVFALTASMFFEAIHYTSVGIATVIAALTPVVAMPVAFRYLHERPTWLGVACAAGAIAGVGLFVAPGYRDANTSPRGLLLAIGSMLAWVVYLFITKKARAGIGTLEYMTAMNLTAAATVLPLLVLFDRRSIMPPAGGWGWIVLLALVPGFLGHGLLTWAQPLVDLSVSSILLQAEPVCAAIAAAIFLGETIIPIQAAGMVLAAASLAVLARSSIGGGEEEPAATPPASPTSGPTVDVAPTISGQPAPAPLSGAE